jgi:hypothetical protein
MHGVDVKAARIDVDDVPVLPAADHDHIVAWTVGPDVPR